MSYYQEPCCKLDYFNELNHFNLMLMYALSNYYEKLQDFLLKCIAHTFNFIVKQLNMLTENFVLQEHFLVPDHTIKDISGASFAGFYYICFQKSTASIEGYYYHRSSEWSVFLTRFCGNGRPKEFEMGHSLEVYLKVIGRLLQDVQTQA